MTPKLPSTKAARTIVRTRVAAALGKLKEPTSEQLPGWKRQAIYAEVGEKFGTSWRTIQDTYLKAKEH